MVEKNSQASAIGSSQSWSLELQVGNRMLQLNSSATKRREKNQNPWFTGQWYFLVYSGLLTWRSMLHAITGMTGTLYSCSHVYFVENSESLCMFFPTSSIMTNESEDSQLYTWMDSLVLHSTSKVSEKDDNYYDSADCMHVLLLLFSFTSLMFLFLTLR